MPRTSSDPSGIRALGPSLFRARAEPVLPDVVPPPAPEPQGRVVPARLTRLALIGLAIAAVVPPLGFAARPGDLGVFFGVPVSIALTALLILAPALAGVVACLSGLEGLHESFRQRVDKEHEQAALRVFVTAAAVVYAFAAGGRGDAAEPCQIVAALGLAGAWGFLLLALLDRIPSLLRSTIGTVYDAAVLAAFLHVGAAFTAPWFPLFLLGTFYAGFRFGSAALAVAAIANFAGFAAVVATTAFWQQQALLAVGLLIAMVVLPGYVGSMAREVAAARSAAAAAQAARTRFLMVISQALRAPLDAILGNAGTVEPADHEEASMQPSARALLSQFSNILDFSAIEAGAFVPETEAFDLHQLINETLAGRRAEFEGRGSRLRVHVDPALPYRLRGWPQQLAQILDYVVVRASGVSDGGAVRLFVDAARRGGNALELRVVVRDEGTSRPPSGAQAPFNPFSSAGLSGQGAFGLTVVKRLVELMGGRISVESAAAKGGSLTIIAPLVIDEPAVDPELDLGRCLLLIATEDSQFASELAEPLNAWHGDPRWIEGFDGTLAFERSEGSAGNVLIVDGRHHTLAALSFAHRAASGPAAPSFVLMVAEAAQLDGLMELTDGVLDAVLAAPLDDQLLANALHSLPLRRGAAPRPLMVPEMVGPPAEPAGLTAVADEEPQSAAELESATPVTLISAHPRFGTEMQIVDPRAIATLCGLGDGDDFLAEVIDSFGIETREIMKRIVRAAAAADAGNFVRGLHELRSCAANIGGARLCELALAMREISQRELREQGSGIVKKLDDELARLNAALFECLSAHGTAVRREA